MIFKIKYNILDGNVFARMDVGNTEENITFCGVLVMSIEAFKEFRADFERGVDFDPQIRIHAQNPHNVTFVPDTSIRPIWPT